MFNACLYVYIVNYINIVALVFRVLKFSTQFCASVVKYMHIKEVNCAQIVISASFIMV